MADSEKTGEKGVWDFAKIFHAELKATRARGAPIKKMHIERARCSRVFAFCFTRRTPTWEGVVLGYLKDSGVRTLGPMALEQILLSDS